MSENCTSSYELNNRYIRTAHRIGHRALRVIESSYGSGYPHFRSGRTGTDLPYHNRCHGEQVGMDAARLTGVLNLQALHIAIAQVAGHAHDIVQLHGREVDEAESAAWLREQLDHHKVPEAIATMASLAILGTLPLFEKGQLVGQKATELTYPSREAELVSKAVACADIGSLYQPVGPYLAHRLFQEIHGCKPDQEPPFDKLLPFQHAQVALQHTYRYPLPQAEAVFTTPRSKQQVVDYSAQLITRLERGDITSWDQLLTADLEFLKSCN